MHTTIEGLDGGWRPAIIGEYGEVCVAFAYGTQVKLAGLERAARLAGEAFGHEEAGSLSGSGAASMFPSRWRLRLSAGLSAVMGSLLQGRP